MTETTPTTVATPMITPSSVRNARSLWRVRADEETRKSSAVVMSSGLLGLALLVAFLLDDDLVALLDLAEDLEGAGHDLRPRRGPGLGLDHQLARDPSLHLLKDEL